MDAQPTADQRFITHHTWWARRLVRDIDSDTVFVVWTREDATIVLDRDTVYLFKTPPGLEIPEWAHINYIDARGELLATIPRHDC